MKVERLPEPELRFKGGTATYCKAGLEETGPYDAINESHKGKISIGIIGMKEYVEKTKEWVGLCNDFIESRPHKEKEEINKELFPDFPGCGVAFDSKLVAEDRFVQYIPIADYAKLDLYNDIKYTEGLLSLFEEKVKLMLDISGDAKPDVILCPLTDEMYERGHVAGDYHRKLKKEKGS